MKKTATALLALTATVAFAAPHADTFYLGGKVGQSSFHKTVRLNSTNTEFQNGANKAYHNGAGTSYGLYAGYRLNDHVALELGWQKVASNKYFLSQGTLQQRANVYDFGGKFNQFIGKNVNVYGGLGLGLAFNEIDKGLLTYGKNVNSRIKKTNVTPYVSVGAQYLFNNMFAVGAEFKTYIREFSTSGEAAVGKTAISLDGAFTNNTRKYRPNVQLLQATATYYFGQHMPVVAPAAPVIVRQKFELKTDLLFKLSSYKLNMNKAQEAFAGVLAKYRSAQDPTVEVVGHADRTGNPASNVVLSQKRAQAVANYLEANGVNRNVVTVRGVGSSQPVTNGCWNVTNRKALAACLAPDRRVDVYVSGVVVKDEK